MPQDITQKTFVSPGVYTSEKDITFITRQVGVTTLGMVGETTIGPAFQPIFISNYGEFQSFFGGLDATKVKDTGAQLYELPYIAKSYLSQSNQLFVTRVLGFSGYDAGLAWGITLDAAMDPATVSAITINFSSSIYSLGRATEAEAVAGTVLTLTAPQYFATGNINETTLVGTPSFGTGSDLGLDGLVVFDVIALHNTLAALTGTTIITPSAIEGDNYGNGVGVFVPGVYTTGGAINMTATKSITLKGDGDYVFLASNGAITFGANDNMILTDGAHASRIFWVANNAINIGANNNLFGTFISGQGDITVGSTVNIVGHLLSPNAITIDGTASSFMLPSTASTTTVSYNPLISYTATTGGTIIITSNDPLIQQLANEGLLTSLNGILPIAFTGLTIPVTATYTKSGCTFNGAAFTLYVLSNGLDINGNMTGVTSGTSTHYSGTCYAGVQDQLVALLRSRGTVDFNTQFPDFEVTGATGVIFDPAYSASTADPLGNFSLSGVSTLHGAFDYTVSLDRTKLNYLPKVLGRGAQDGKTALFVEELYTNMFATLNAAGKIRGINQTIVDYGIQFSDYLNQYQPAVTPWIVSELRGNKVLELFRFNTISDGNAANEQFKISITNIKPDTKEFDVQVRAFYDTDANPKILETYSKCLMNPASAQYVGRRIGTLDGVYTSKSSYVLVEMNDNSDTSTAFPAGFIGYPIRDYQLNSNSGVTNPNIMYKLTYNTFENKRKFYLGLSNTVGIDSDFFNYKGVPQTTTPNIWTGLTDGFHMDVNASGVTIDGVVIVINNSGGTYSPIFKFDTGNAAFESEAGVIGTDYEKLYARKFTLAPFGGFDGWDIYNTRRTNTDKYIINGVYGAAGLTSGAFSNRVLTTGDLGINSDYYAYLEAIYTFNNPRAVNINVFATPGIDTVDNTNLIESAIEMIEVNRADSLYIVTTPDTDGSGNVLSPSDVAGNLSGQFDSNYTATYYPWIQINDAENNVFVFVPPTRDVVRNIALTDNIAFPWFAVAGMQRGQVDCIKARVKITQADSDILYENRINPLVTFTTDGVVIFGNKTLQVADTYLNRINVRRLLLQARKLISAVSVRLLFEQNDTVVRNQFLALVNPILDSIRTERGLSDFRVVLSNSPEDMDRNQLTGQIFLKPTTALEFIQLDFIIMDKGASFDNI
jgi:phage tail sheath protein FI